MYNQTNNVNLENKEMLLHTKNLCFSYAKSSFSINDVQMNIPKGCIYGFLGRNGSGKTTIIQLLLGLLRPSQGAIYFEKEDIKINKFKYLSNIGNIIEYPSLYEHLTVEDNLIYHVTVRSCSILEIPQVLELVGLSTKRASKVSTLSLGMKQRLGIAIALCHQPNLLIFDEPTNGLDPLGIIDLRNLLLKLRTQGKTILFSSHLLSEVSKICDMIGIIENGRLIGEYSMDRLNQAYNSIYILKSDRIEILKTICVAKNWNFKEIHKSKQIEINIGSSSSLNVLLSEIHIQNIVVESIEKKQILLEDFYISSLL